MTNTPDRNDLLLIGQFMLPHGVRGQVKLHAITDQRQHLGRVKTIFVGDALTSYRLQRAVEHKGTTMIVALVGITTRDQAETLRGQEVFIRQQDAAPLADDEYFLHDLPGLRVETITGELLGSVKEVIETGANEVLVVTRPAGGEALIPMIKDVVKQLDIAAGLIVIEPLPGLLD